MKRASEAIDVQLNNAAYSRGDESFRAQRYREALAHFREALEADLGDSASLFAMGNCYSALRKHERAENSFRQAITLAPSTEHPALLFNLGNALFDQGRFAEAVDVYAQVPHGDKVWPACSRNLKLASERLKD